MKFTETKLGGIFLIEPRRFSDARGFFAPSFSARDFAEHGLASQFVENNISFSQRSGTIRGMHYQAAPYGQDKLVRCTKGAIFDVAVDLRRDSATFRQWVGVELTAENRSMLYVPRDCGHGFQTLVDNTEVFYQVTNVYAPESGKGFRWDDPAFGIKWPETNERVLVERDKNYADFTL